MKRTFYLLVGGLLTSTLAIGQVSKTHTIEKKGVDRHTDKTSVSTAKDFNDPVWEDDFSDPSVWTIDNNAGNEDNWVIGTDVPSGAFAIDGIASTTAANGFALFDSDLLCSGNQDAWIRNTDPIDLSNESLIAIQMETYYRQYQGTCYIETSVDGETWGNSVEILNVGVNNSTDNPTLFTLTLDGIAGSSTAYIRFRYEGGCDYAWMIDDIKLAAPPANDLSLKGAYYDEYVTFLDLDEFLDVDYVQHLEHSQYKANQVRPLTFIADIENTGVNEQTGVTVTAVVSTPDGTETYTSDATSIAAGERSYVMIPDVMLDAFDGGTGSIGDYSVEISISQDQEDEIPDNNMPITKSFKVDEDFMASDLDTDWTTYYPTLGENAIWASRVMFENEDQVNAIQFGILNTDDAPSSPGDVCYLNMRRGSVLEAEGEDNEMFRYFDEEEVEYVLTEADFTTSEVTTWITMIIDNDGVDVEPGVVYQAELEIPALGESYLWIPFSNGQSEYTGLLFDYYEQSGGPQGWWTLGQNNPHLRLGFSGSVGTDERSDLNFKMDQNFPNPSNGTTSVKWELLEPANNVDFFITDVTGKIVYSKSFGSRPAGVQEQMNLSLDLPAGTYQYALQIGNQRLVRKMIVTK